MVAKVDIGHGVVLRNATTGVPYNVGDAGENHIGSVGGHTAVVSSTVTRPSNTTQYAIADLIANSETAGSVTAMSWTTAARVAAGSFMLRRARLYKDDDDVTAAQFRLHLFDSDPASTNPANGDNGAISLTNVLDNHLGSIDFDMTASPDIHTEGNMAIGVPIQGFEISVKLSSGRTIYGLLEARATYTPASGEVFTAVLELLQD